MKPPQALHRLSRRPTPLCSTCLSHRPRPRPYSSTDRPPTPPRAAYARLTSRRLISLTGPDATHYLQGVITANVSAAARTTGFYAAFLNAQGRLLNDVFVYPDAREAGWLIEADAREAERLARHIKRYRLRAKFEVRVLGEGERDVWSVWGGEEGWTPHSLEGGEGGVGCVDARAPGMGRRVVLGGGERPDVDGDEVGEECYRVRRYLRGVPEGQEELIREAALPQESNIDYMGGVDYRKGCYVGQELTIRTHHTGVVRKRILPVMIYEKDEPAPDALEYSPAKDLGAESIPKETSIGRVEKRGRSAGKWLTGVGNIGLGLCRLEIMTDIQVQGEAGGYKDGDEFKLEWQVEGGGPETVKVKAFVPPWHTSK